MAAVVAVLAVVVAVVLPPIFGGIARSLLDDLDSGIGVGQALGADAEVVAAFHDWDEGWFTSTASLSLNAEIGGITLFSAEAPVIAILRHGPIISGTPSGLGFASIELVPNESAVPFLQEIRDLAGVDVIPHLGVLLGFGGVTVAFDVPDFRIVEPDEGVDFHFGGLEAVAEVASDSIDFDAELGGLRAFNRNRGADIGRIDLMVSLYKDARMPVLWLGDIGVDSDGFRIVDKDNGAEVGAFRARIGTGIARNTFDARIEGALSQVGFRMDDVGLRLNDLAADLGVEYDAGSLARLMARLKDAVGAFSPDSLIGAVGAFGSFGSLLPRDPEALARDAEALARERLFLGIRRLSFTHEERSASAALAFEFRGDELPSGFLLRFLSEPNAARLPITANFDLAFHRDLVRGLGHSQGVNESVESVIREIEGGLQEMALGGALERRGDDYTVRVEFDNGVLLLNGARLEHVIRRLEARRSEPAQEVAEALRPLAEFLSHLQGAPDARYY